eukprot:jgi/Mesvir1/18968/Mv18935-RA.1
MWSRGTRSGPRAKAAMLEKEALDMEARLAELRTAMAREKAKRDTIKSTTESGGTIWGSARQRGASQPSTQASSRASSSRSERSGSASKSGRGAEAGASSSASPPPVGAQRPVPPSARGASPGGAVRPGAGAKAATSSSGQGTYEGGGMLNREDFWQMPSFPEPAAPTPAPMPRRRGAPIEPAVDEGNSSGAEAAFDEAESHNSFLEALMEWRRGGADASGSSADKPGSAASASGRGGGKSAHAVGHEIEIQTESPARPLARPPSARPTSRQKKASYFDQLCKDVPASDKSGAPAVLTTPADASASEIMAAT